MQYEFELFDKIIAGELSPFLPHFHETVNYIDVIKSKHKTSYNYITATFKKSGNSHVLIDKKNISSLYPQVENVIARQENLFQDNISEFLSKKAIKSLAINPDNMISHTCTIRDGKIIAHIKEHRKWEDLSIREARFYYYNDLLNDEIVKIKLSIKSTVLKYNQKEETEHYVHKLQRALLSLCFQLNKLSDQKPTKEVYKIATEFTSTDILNLTYIYLEKLLLFIERDFFNYIDINVDVPYRTELLKIYDTTNKLEIVRTSLHTSDLSQPVLEILYFPFIKLNAFLTEEKITYKELIYFSAYLDFFYDYFKENINIDDSKAFRIMVELNFNSPNAVACKSDKLQIALNELGAIPDKIDFLYLKLKNFSQLQQRSHLIYNSGLPPLKNLITSLIEEEINYYNKKLKLKETPLNLFTSHHSQPEHPPVDKIMVALSVPQLASFFKLVSDVGIIAHENQMDVIRMIAGNFRTAKVADISINSLRTNFYNPDETTLGVIRDFTIKMLNALKV